VQTMNTDTHAHNMKGIALVLIGALMLALMDGVMKHLLDHGHSVMKMLAVRGWFIVPIMAIWAWKKMPDGTLKTNQPWIHGMRAVIGFFVPLFFFTALTTMPLADATVILFGATFMITALSVPLLKEYVGPHRWAAVAFGFIGVGIAANPTGDIWNGGAVYALLASLAYALIMLMTRWMGPGENAFAQVFYFNTWSAIVATVIAIPSFTSISSMDVGWIFLMGVFSVVGHWCLTRAFSIAPVGLVAPFEYSIIIWATLIGFLGWGQVPGYEVITGGVVVVASGLYLFQRENALKAEAP